MPSQPSSRPAPDGPFCLCYRWCRVLAWQGHRRCIAERIARGPRPQGGDAQARPLHQRRSGHHEPLSARRGVRHRRRRRDGPRSGPLRALHPGAHEPAQQFHHGPRLPKRDLQGAPRRIPRCHRAGHPPYHRGDQAPRARGGGRCGHRHGGDRRHGRRHRVAALHGGDPPDGGRTRARQRHVHPPDAGALHRQFGGGEDQADPALGQGTALDRHPARCAVVPRRRGVARGRAAQDRALHERARTRRGVGDRRRSDLSHPRHLPAPRARRHHARALRDARCTAAAGPVGVGSGVGWSGPSRTGRHHRHDWQVHRSSRFLQVAQ